MDECEIISDMLIDYINRRLTQTENCQVIRHIAVCRHCRSEAAALIEIKNLAQYDMSSIPQDILDSAFERVPKKERKLGSIINPGSYSNAFDLINSSLTVVKQTIQLARQAI